MRNSVIAFAAVVFLPLAALADPLSSCTNIGGQLTSPSYTISGTTYNICSGCVDGETVADVNGLSLSPGDAVLFKAGEVFTVSTENNRLNMVSGVLYGRYGTGANPIIRGSAGLTFSVNFRSLIEADSDSNITFDGIDVDNSPSGGIMIRNTATSSVSNQTITNTEGWGIAFINGTDHVADKLVINAADGGPHESITMSGANGVVVSNIRSVGNGHAAINIKDGSQNVEIFGSEFAQTGNDPLFYIERATNVWVHDNWIHDAISVNDKALINIAVEPLGGAQYNREILIEHNVIISNNGFGQRFWIKDGVDTLQEPNFQNVTVRNNSYIQTGQGGQSFYSAIDAYDSRGTNNGAWDNLVIRNNIIWDTDVADGISLRQVNASEFTIEYNLFETGESGGSDLGTNTVFTGTPPFVDLANNDFDPAGAAIGAGSGGGDIGASVTWTCGLGSDPNPTPTLNPITTAKPDPHQVDNLEPHYPDHLYVMNDATGGTTIDDEGGGTACDLTINGATQSADDYGTYWVFNAVESDTMTSSCADPPTTTGVTCVIYSYPAPPAEVQTPVSWGDADDAFQVAAINIVNGSGNARAGICAGPSSCSGNTNTGPVSITDDAVNMACVRQSGSANDIWVNDSGWQVSSWGGSFDWSQIDTLTVGAQGRSSTDQYASGYIRAVFSYDGDKTDAEMSTIYNDSGSGADPWAQIGIDPTSTPPTPSNNTGDYGNVAN